MNGSQFPYEDIVNLPHHVSRNRPQMPLRDRAAQFAPFAALTGYGEAIDETARWTEERRELDENERAILDSRLRFLSARLEEQPPVEIEHFVPDSRKAGGSYVRTEGKLVSIATSSRTLQLADGTGVDLNDIVKIESPLFDMMEELWP